MTLTTATVPAAFLAKPAGRRRAIAVAMSFGLCAFRPGAWALSPQAPPTPTLEDHVLQAELIVIGSVERFVFRGSDIEAREEYGKDFSDGISSSKRTLDAFVRVEKILKNRIAAEIPRIVRAQRPVPRANHEIYLSTKAIYFFKRGALLHGGDPQSRLFLSVVDALPMSSEEIVAKAIVKNQSKSKQ